MANIVITGASRGIGRAIALEFGKEGCNKIYITHKDYNNMERFEKIKTLLQNNSNIVTGMFLDVTGRTWLNKLIKILNKDNDFKIDYLINNAGITQDHMLKNMSDEEWDNVINTNLTGIFNVTKAFLPYMNPNGCIINITSIVGIKGAFGQTNYAASKAGVIGFTKALAKETAKDGIRVNAVACGYVDTDMTKSIPQDIKEKILDSIPMKRFARPEEIAKIVTFICRDATYMTGSVIVVDGGLT